MATILRSGAGQVNAIPREPRERKGRKEACRRRQWKQASLGPDTDESEGTKLASERISKLVGAMDRAAGRGRTFVLS